MTLVQNNGKRRRRKQLGGCTGKGFMPGSSGNPGGRPRTQGLLQALRSILTDCDSQGRTVEERLVKALIDEALKSKRRLPAILAIFDRLEGRPQQALILKHDNFDPRTWSEEQIVAYENFVIANQRDPTKEEMAHYGQHGKYPDACWPTAEALDLPALP